MREYALMFYIFTIQAATLQQLLYLWEAIASECIKVLGPKFIVLVAVWEGGWMGRHCGNLAGHLMQVNILLKGLLGSGWNGISVRMPLSMIPYIHGPYTCSVCAMLHSAATLLLQHAVHQGQALYMYL
jgi:hypothetical protein